MIIYYSLTGSGSSCRSSFLTPSCWVGWRGGGRGGVDLDEWQRWKNGGGGRGGRGSRHTQCTVMEIHCNFCLKILLFHFSKNVSVCYQSSFHHLLSFQCLYHRRVHAIQESKAVLSPQNASARLSNVNLFSGTASSTSCSSSSSSGWEPFISIKWYFVNSSAVGSVSSWVFPRSVFWDSAPPPTLSCLMHSLFLDFLDWLCHKSYEGMQNTWTVFFSRNLLFGLSWSLCVCVCVCLTTIASSVV